MWSERGGGGFGIFTSVVVAEFYAGLHPRGGRPRWTRWPLECNTLDEAVAALAPSLAT